MNTQHPNYGAFQDGLGTKSYRARQLIQALVALNTATHKELTPSGTLPSAQPGGTWGQPYLHRLAPFYSEAA